MIFMDILESSFPISPLVVKRWHKNFDKASFYAFKKFLLDLSSWFVSPIDSIWSPQTSLQSNYGRLIPIDLQSYILKSQTLFHIAQFGAMMR
jgi:hypothetical protein